MQKFFNSIQLNRSVLNLNLLKILLKIPLYTCFLNGKFLIGELLLRIIYINPHNSIYFKTIQYRFICNDLSNKRNNLISKVIILEAIYIELFIYWGKGDWNCHLYYHLFLQLKVCSFNSTGLFLLKGDGLCVQCS